MRGADAYTRTRTACVFRFFDGFLKEGVSDNSWTVSACRDRH